MLEFGSIEKLIIFDLPDESEPDGWFNFKHISLDEILIFLDETPNFFERPTFGFPQPPPYDELLNARTAPPPPPPSPLVVQPAADWFPPLLPTDPFIPPVEPEPATRVLPPPIESPTPGVTHFLYIPPVHIPLSPVNNEIYAEEENNEVFMTLETPITITIL